MSEDDPFRLFVYGTLKRGFAARERFLERTEVTDGVVSGDIYALDAGYPAITVPEGGIRAVGTADIGSDLLLQDADEVETPEGPLVYGEIVAMTRIVAMHDIDDYEGFVSERPDGGLYRRVLVSAARVGSRDDGLLVWTYAMRDPEGRHLPDGRWDGP